jgi:hypothetical protein
MRLYLVQKSKQRRDAKVILFCISPLIFTTFPNGRVSAFLIYFIAVVLSPAINGELLPNVEWLINIPLRRNNFVAGFDTKKTSEKKSSSRSSFVSCNS